MALYRLREGNFTYEHMIRMIVAIDEHMGCAILNTISRGGYPGVYELRGARYGKRRHERLNGVVPAAIQFIDLINDKDIRDDVEVEDIGRRAGKSKAVTRAAVERINWVTPTSSLASGPCTAVDNITTSKWGLVQALAREELERQREAGAANVAILDVEQPTTQSSFFRGTDHVHLSQPRAEDETFDIAPAGRISIYSRETQMVGVPEDADQRAAKFSYEERLEAWERMGAAGVTGWPCKVRKDTIIVEFFGRKRRLEQDCFGDRTALEDGTKAVLKLVPIARDGSAC
ncbi:hypothetical protein BDZ90DRAFT_121884, partial [Jaminaea rosea]